MSKKSWRNRLLKILLFFLFTILFLEWFLSVSPPEITDTSAWELKRIKTDTNYYKINNCWLRKNKYGLWEAYIEGSPFERGAILGNLAKELIIKQEDYFVAQIKALVPSTSFLYLLRYLIGFFNRNLDDHIPEEYLKEIYGETHFASSEYNVIGSNYKRILNYHAAHDIGHALKDYAVVGCTSFSCWNNKSKDSSLIVGRNFDFYVGDDFAKDKIILFVSPEKGYKFASVTWGGFMGVCSGMNEKGLTVTLNAAKSGLPSSAKTPISIVARDILQYAKNIAEAYEIAKKHDTFVSESIMIGSAEDNTTAIIEKSITKTILYLSDSSSIICSNHYQSDAFKNDTDNNSNIMNSASSYRQKRTNELLNTNGSVDYLDVADILRDMNGANNKNLGFGNEKAINQLQGHHAVIFKPKEKIMWVSTAPYQLGPFIPYDLNIIFQKNSDKRNIVVDSMIIPKDSFADSFAFENYMLFRKIKKELKEITNWVSLPTSVGDSLSEQVQKLNPDYYLAFETAGNYYKKTGQHGLAINAYKIALEKEIATIEEKNNIRENLDYCRNENRKLHEISNK